jgi:hypothetical protein
MAATLSEHLNTDLQPRSAPTRVGAIARFERTTNRKSQAHPGRAFAAQFSAGYTTNISGLDLRQA